MKGANAADRVVAVTVHCRGRSEREQAGIAEAFINDLLDAAPTPERAIGTLRSHLMASLACLVGLDEYVRGTER